MRNFNDDDTVRLTAMACATRNIPYHEHVADAAAMDDADVQYELQFKTDVRKCSDVEYANAILDVLFDRYLDELKRAN